MQVNIQQTIALAMCLIQLPYFTSAFFSAAGFRKKSKGTKVVNKRIYSDITFKDELPPVTMGPKHGSVILECEAQAIPAPTVHWLKNGVRLSQGYSNYVEDDAATFEDHREGAKQEMISVSSTKSRLHLDCLNGRDAAVYTCVAETPYLKNTQNTTVKVVKRDSEIFEEISSCYGKRSFKATSPAHIHMWTVSRLEYEGVKVQLFCRAQGYPQPTVTWYDRDNEPITDDDPAYQLLDNGDLVVNSISWVQNMGVYTCIADNGVGSDTSNTFLYPAARH